MADVDPCLLRQVMGVIDLRGGQAVHAVAGRRREYLPVYLPPLPRGDAVALAEWYQQIGVGGIYVADLDAICQQSDDSCSTLQSLAARTCLPLWVDRGWGRSPENPPAMGVADMDEFAQTVAAAGSRFHWIVASETLADLEYLKALARRPAKAAQIAVSLDFRDGQLCTPLRSWQGNGWQRAVSDCLSAGIRRFVMLDLAKVGTGSGPCLLGVCHWIRQQSNEACLIAGGGARDEADVRGWLDAGCDWVLSATWLHSLLPRLLAGPAD